VRNVARADIVTSVASLKQAIDTVRNHLRAMYTVADVMQSTIDMISATIRSPTDHVADCATCARSPCVRAGAAHPC